MTAAMSVNGTALARYSQLCAGVERMRECCELIAQAPSAAEDQAGRQAHQAVTGAERSGDGMQGSPGDGDRGRAHRRPACTRQPSPSPTTAPTGPPGPPSPAALTEGAVNKFPGGNSGHGCSARPRAGRNGVTDCSLAARPASGWFRRGVLAGRRPRVSPSRVTV